MGRCNTMIFCVFVLKPLGEGSSVWYFYQIDDFDTNLVGSLTQMNVSYASSFFSAPYVGSFMTIVLYVRPVAHVVSCSSFDGCWLG